MSTVAPEPIMRIAMGFMAAKFLFVANEIGLFEALATGPTTLEELAKRTAAPSRTVGVVADAMVSLGLIEHEGIHYRNSVAAAAFLAGKPDHDLRPMLHYFDGLSYPQWQVLGDAVRNDKRQPQFGKFDQTLQQLYSAGVEAFTAPVAAALATTYDFGRHRRLLDVAGGTGSFLIAVLRQYPGLKGTLFELPGACAVAKRRLSQEPDRTRIDIVEGDVFKVPLPGDHDVVLVANLIHMFSPAHNIELMTRIRAASQMGVRLLLVDFWPDPAHSEAAALMSGEFLLISGEGQTYSEQAADEWLKPTKWRKLERKPLSGPISLIVSEAI
jgi:ubiquinone/menaquinone biosynthesis C-methylase UbiE